MTDTIAHTPLPEPAAHILEHDLVRFAKEETSAYAYSLPYRCHLRGSSVPLYTAQQMREYRDAPAAWVPLTDEDRTRAFQSLPDMLEGFMKTWGWLHFAKAIEAICREKNEQATGENP